jgi:polar amino acid transport system permease protein
VALRPGRRPDVAVADRSSRILGSGAGRSAAIALVSTVLVFTAITLVVVNSPGWPEFKASFLNWDEVKVWFPDIARHFWVNVKLFMVCEAVILVFALGIAILRSLPGPVLFPFRLMAIVYTDLFRGVPTILVVVMLGLGVPSLQLSGVPTSELFWGGVALILVYSAYVAEVYRAGIESVHPSQEAAARSLGLSRLQALRFVIVPQAVRRVIPPLLNDFIGLQKDTALVAIIGPVEAFRQADIAQAADFNFTPYLCAAALFVLITIPLARFTDWLVARDRRRQFAGHG